MLQERITYESSPAIMAEHVARYRLAAQFVGRSEVWADLGCGAGVGAESLVREAGAPPSVLLYEFDREALDEAGRRLRALDVVPECVQADLSDESTIEALRARLLELAGGSPLLVTLFEVIEHLPSHVPLMAMLDDLAQRQAATVLVSVPNDEFWAARNPFHVTTWGRGAVDELVSGLRASATVLEQFALVGSAIATPGGVHDVPLPDSVPVDTAMPPSNFVICLGDSVPSDGGEAVIAQHDHERQRDWDRQREADIVYLRGVEEMYVRLREDVLNSQKTGLRSGLRAGRRRR